MEGYTVSYVAANNGSSAMITREGELYMFGKDSVHCNCDYATGHVVDLKDHVITQVAIGKAHIIALTKEGEVFSFGMNNKGQCGREFAAPKEVTATATANSGLFVCASTCRRNSQSLFVGHGVPRFLQAIDSSIWLFSMRSEWNFWVRL